MKKSIIIFSAVIATLSLLAFGFMNSKDSETGRVETSGIENVALNKQVVEPSIGPNFPDFFYDVGSRFNVIKKGDLDKATSFSDFIGEAHVNRIVSYKSLSVIILDGDKQTDKKETGNDGTLTAAQVKLLQSLAYSTNLLIRADYREKNIETGQIEDSYWTPYLTIVPETQAVYAGGKKGLITYLKENSKKNIVIVQEDKLRPANLFFTVTKKGVIENVKLDGTSGYPSIDKTMIELIKTLPEAWEPARNSNGELVNQELVFSFGNRGC